MLKWFPFDSKQTFWGKESKGEGDQFTAECNNDVLSLLPYYFTLNGTLADGYDWGNSKHLFGNLIAGPWVLELL